MKTLPLLQTAAGVLLFPTAFFFLIVVLEKKIVYYPLKYPAGEWNPAEYGIRVEDVWFRAPDGVKLHGWFVAAEKPAATLLWFHGNAGNLTHRMDNILRLRPLRLNIFIFDYRGYGKSEGEPSQPGLYRDSQAAYDTLRQVKQVAPGSLFLFGRSLGGACAVEVAARNPAAGLILESTFTSARDMARRMLPLFPLGIFLQSRYNPVDTIASIGMPKLFLHGTADTIVPYELGRKLFEAAREPKTFYDIPGAGHNDTYITGGEPYLQALNRFITANAAQPSKNN